MPEWVKVGTLEEMTEGAGRRFEVAGHRVAIFRIEDALYAIGDECSHAEASLAEGELWDYDVECPRHGSEFDVRTGQPNSLPATRPVPVYELKLEGDDVYLHLEPREAEEAS
ncbi:MAG: non-heme iron oxygenase ferredoxin subunit [Actinomycetota bacterium]|nr:non-heme iron oxygenase ferredoxin subunit [Actinomycetota bacterium]